MDQRRAFRAMLERPSLSSFSVLGSQNSPERIHTSVLLETMVESHNHLQNIILNNVLLKNLFDVEQLHVASALMAGGVGVVAPALTGLIPISAEHSSDFLDPLLEAMLSCHQPNIFSLCGYYAHDDVPPSGLPSLLTTAALRSYLEVYANSTQPEIQLHNLGLEDEHCKAIAELLTPMNCQYPGRKLISLWLTGNGAFSDEGYEALLGLLNRNHCIQEIQVDDSSLWRTASLQTKLDG
jgi:hypothetical protein